VLGFYWRGSVVKKRALIAVARAVLCMPASARNNGKDMLDIGAGPPARAAFSACDRA
jgi:hypothetical protein